jgi:integrase
MTKNDLDSTMIGYAGMRVSDAVTLTTDRLDGKRLFLYTQKTGVPVYTVMPDSVLAVLEATPRVTDTRYFWSAQGQQQTAIGDWPAKIKKVFDLAGISKGLGNTVSHRLRQHARDRAALQPVGTLAVGAT